MELQNGKPLDQMSPYELVVHMRDELDELSLRPQVERDRFAHEVLATCQTRGFEAIRDEDAKLVLGYTRAKSYISKRIDKFLYGAELINFEKHIDID